MKIDLSISNAERVLLGMPLLCRVTICCIKDQVPVFCDNLQGQIAELLGRAEPQKQYWPCEYKYRIRTSRIPDVCVVDVEILP